MLRRRSPAWLRDLPDRQVHGIAGRLALLRPNGLTSRQEWLWDACISELEYRRRHHTRNGTVLAACSCWLCIPTDYILDPGDLDVPEGV